MNIDKKKYLIVTSLASIMGVLFFVFYHQLIVLHVPFYHPTLGASVITKKKITLHYFHHGQWKTEIQEQLWSENSSKNLSQVINAWLTLLDDERIVAQKTALQSLLCSQSGVAYLSCNHAIFSQDDTIFKKWMIIEGALKTIRDTGIAIQSVQFLINHQEQQDPHLDFSLPWPITGFLL